MSHATCKTVLTTDFDEGSTLHDWQDQNDEVKRRPGDKLSSTEETKRSE